MEFVGQLKDGNSLGDDGERNTIKNLNYCVVVVVRTCHAILGLIIVPSLPGSTRLGTILS